MTTHTDPTAPAEARVDPDFAAFYGEVRQRLLLQTWALTGDLPAAEKAVRDAFVIAAHHWRKVRRLPGPAEGDGEETREDWVRPLAWGRAQRRHSVPHLHRTRGLSPEIKATLQALGKLSITQRKVLLLAHLSGVSLEQLAREVGITTARVEQELHSGTALFTQHREVPDGNVLAAFEPLAEEVNRRPAPPVGTLTKAGSQRRRAHTALGAVAAMAALVGSGLFVAQQADSVPQLAALSFSDSDDDPEAPAEEPYPLDPSDLVTPATLKQRLGGAWTTELTSDDKGGTGLVLPCHQRRFADRDAEAALARTFTARGPGVTASQTVEASRSPEAAKASFDRAVTWYAACTDTRVQLITTQQLTGVGNESTVVALRDWDRPKNFVVVGVSRTGSVVTSVATTVPTLPRTSVPQVTSLLGDAVKNACRLPGAAACVTTPKAQEIAPLSTGKHPQMLTEIDLPPVSGVEKPWVGTDPERAKHNLAATRCDNTAFTGRLFGENWTRTFVIPEATRLDTAFGLTQTVGTFPAADGAKIFVGSVQKKLASCTDRELGSHVTSLGGSDTKDRQTHLWRVEVETSPKTSVTYLMAVVRQDNSVAQIGFVPSGEVTMSAEDFQALAERAAERLTHA